MLGDGIVFTFRVPGKSQRRPFGTSLRPKWTSRGRPGDFFVPTGISYYLIQSELHPFFSCFCTSFAQDFLCLELSLTRPRWRAWSHIVLEYNNENMRFIRPLLAIQIAYIICSNDNKEKRKHLSENLTQACIFVQTFFLFCFFLFHFLFFFIYLFLTTAWCSKQNKCQNQVITTVDERTNKKR